MLEMKKKFYLISSEQLVGCHPLPRQAKEKLMKLEENLLLMLLACPMKLWRVLGGWLLLVLLKDDLKRLGQVLMER